MRRIWFLLIIGFVLTLFIDCLFASPWSKAMLKGSVVDYDNISQFLGGVKVSIEGTNEWAVTDDYGEFIFKDLPKGKYLLCFKKKGYMPETKEVEVDGKEVSNIEIELLKAKDILSLRMWMKEIAVRLKKLFVNHNITGKKIAIVYYLQIGTRTCEQPKMMVNFATIFNASLKNDKNVIVVRDANQASYLIDELKKQQQFKIDYDPATVADIGKKVGADVIIIGAIEKKRKYYEPFINATSVEKHILIPGLSIIEPWIKPNALTCE